MRTLLRNKKKLWYSNYETKDAEPKVDKHGNVLKTGNTEEYYTPPTKFKGNIAKSGSGDAETKEYGLDLSDYNAILIVDKGVCPIKEGSLIWENTEPKTDVHGNADKSSADYQVSSHPDSLNVDKYILKRLVN